MLVRYIFSSFVLKHNVFSENPDKSCVMRRHDQSDKSSHVFSTLRNRFKKLNILKIKNFIMQCGKSKYNCTYKHLNNYTLS